MGTGEQTSRAVEDYLKAIYQLREAGHPVQSTSLADRLGVAAPSATHMMAKLAEAGLLHYSPYKKVELTPAGAAVALRVIRHHRLWETFLHQSLSVPLDQLHDEAERLEHELSDVLEEQMSRALGDPTHDPHGHPIPGRDGRLPATRWSSLAALPVGGAGVVRQVPDHDPEFLRYLMSLGLVPGAQVELRRSEPFRGPLTISVDGVEHVVSPDLAESVDIEPD